jgi:hypothetical protein
VRAYLLVARDLLGFAGIGLLSYGAWLVLPPTGFMVGGALLYLTARAAPLPPEGG